MADIQFLPNCRKKGSPANEQTLNFIRNVYGDSSFDGQIAFSVKNKNGVFRSMGSACCSQITNFVEQMTIFPNYDYYISSNAFTSTDRSYGKLLAVNNLVIDIDCHEDRQPDLMEQQIDALVWRLTNDLFDCGDLPTPHCIVFTGRGIQIWWCLVPAYAPKFMGAFKHVESHFASKIDR